MTDGPPGGNGYQIMENTVSGRPAAWDGRLLYNNYGKGVRTAIK